MRDKPPAALLIPCDRSRKPVNTVGEVVTRMQDSEAKLDKCAAKVDGIAAYYDDGK